MKLPRLKIWKHIFIGVLIILPILAGVYTISSVTNKPLSGLTMDPAETFKAVPYVGILSHLGVIFWSATFGVCLLGALVLRRKDVRMSWFMFASAALGLLLTLDDALLLHEQVFPHYLHFPQKWVLLSYGVMTLVYFFTFVGRS